MQQLACPGCGAPINFRSSASVFAVCEFCKTTVLKDADSVRDLGKMSAILEDYSPLQMHSTGIFQGHGFSVVGRLQLRYDAGFWNEWYILFDSGQAAWLSDASGQYTITMERTGATGLPSFASLVPGAVTSIAQSAFVAADIRTAKCVAGEGELPFQVGAGYEARVADFRHDNQFVTLDYSDGEVPRLFVGQAVTLDGLKCQLLRSPETITDSAGRFRGKVEALNCPSCGGAISFSPGMTTHLLCPHCQSAIDVSSSQAEVIAAGQRVQAVHTSLQLGERATIEGTAYNLMGLMVREELDDHSRWTEYLLYSAQKGFLWLVESSEGWQRTVVLDQWPSRNSGGDAVIGTKSFSKLYAYSAQVVFAVGSFNWRVMVGDTSQIVEFGFDNERLAAEVDRAELTWSYGQPVAAEQVRQWFEHAGAKTALPDTGAIDSRPLEPTARIFVYALIILNIVPFLLNEGITMLFVILASLAIYLPAIVIDAMARSNP